MHMVEPAWIRQVERMVARGQFARSIEFVGYIGAN